MLVLLVTAFSIYRLFGGFGIFHIAAVVSTVTLAGGMLPVLFKKPRHYILLHYTFMYWSVIGLYAAFISETLTRIPDSPFLGTVGIATFTVTILAQIGFYKYKKKWEERFDHYNNTVKV